MEWLVPIDYSLGAMEAEGVEEAAAVVVSRTYSMVVFVALVFLIPLVVVVEFH